MNPKKILYICLGMSGVGLGALGAVLPLMPAFPFLMLALWSFGKSSERLTNWFVSTKLYKNNLETFVRGEGMTWKTKIRVMSTITLVMLISFVMMRNVPVGQICLACVWVFHIFYFCKMVKTIASKEKIRPELAGE